MSGSAPRCGTEGQPTADSQFEAELRQDGYTGNELTQIRDLIEVFSHGNRPYLLLATFARLLLEGYELSPQRQVEPGSHTSAPEPHAQLVLKEVHHGDSALRHLYEEIRTTLGLPFVNTDYRALARWPSYFSRAWSDVRPQILSAAYEPLMARPHAKAVHLALALPNPGVLSSDTLQAAAQQDGALEEIGDVVRLFQYLLPGLISNIALFRAQLLPAGLETSAQTEFGA